MHRFTNLTHLRFPREQQPESVSILPPCNLSCLVFFYTSWSLFSLRSLTDDLDVCFVQRAGFRQRSCFSQCFRAMLHLAPQNDSEMRIILNYIRIITRGKWKVWNHVDKCLMKFTVTHINYWKWPPRWNRCIEKWSYVRWWQPGSRLIKTEDGYHLNWSCWRLLVSSCLLDCRVDITFVLLFRWLIEGAAQLRMSRS